MAEETNPMKWIRNRYNKALKSNEPFLVIKYFGRPLAFPFVLLFEKLPLSANHITLLSGLCWAMGMGILLTIEKNNYLLFAISALFLLLGGVLDIVDGGIARIRKTFSMSGAYLDFALHHVFNPILTVCIGYFLAKNGNDWLLFLGIAAVPGGWGFSQTAKQFILLKQRKLIIETSSDASDSEYHQLFFDSSGAPHPISVSPTLITTLKKIAVEFFFPGNFFTFPAAMVIDLILIKTGMEIRYPALTTLFILYAGSLTSSIPFRIKREFNTLSAFESKMNPLK